MPDAPLNDAGQRPIDAGVIDVGPVPGMGFEVWQQLNAEIGREHHSDHPETRSEIETTQKMPLVYSPVEDCAMPTGKNPAAVTSVPVSMGKAVVSQAKAAAFTLSQPCSIFTTIISTAMIASSTRSPNEMIRAPSVIRCKSKP